MWFCKWQGFLKRMIILQIFECHQYSIKNDFWSYRSTICLQDCPKLLHMIILLVSVVFLCIYSISWMISAVTWLKTIHVLQPWALMFSVCSEDSFIITCFKSISAAIFNTCELVCLLYYVYIFPHVQNFIHTVQPANIQPCRLNILYTSRSLPLRGIVGVCMCIFFCLKIRGMYASMKWLNLMKPVKNMHSLYFTPKVIIMKKIMKNHIFWIQIFCLKKMIHIFRTSRIFFFF